jgi:spore maturation protein CgeB
MKICFVVHSVISCWNNGNAHFLRGVLSALQASGHTVLVLEPADGWSRTNLLIDAGDAALAKNEARLGHLALRLYSSVSQALDSLAAAEPDLVVVHEWNTPGLVNAVGALRRAGEHFVLLFHDTHHRALSQPGEISRFDLSGYDGILVFGACLERIYQRQGWGRRVWTWHEAADISLFRPLSDLPPEGDLAWIGNWGDGERGAELREFLIEPAGQLGLRTTVHGVRYPAQALVALERAGIRYAGWLPNHRVPECFARHRVTMHVPRRPYADALPGIPTIRVFEALACGIPLVSAPWRDEEDLFPAGCYLTARDGDQMRRHLAAVLANRDLAEALRQNGLVAIRARHTCDHRAAELLAICGSLASSQTAAAKIP